MGGPAAIFARAKEEREPAAGERALAIEWNVTYVIRRKEEPKHGILVRPAGAPWKG